MKINFAGQEFILHHSGALYWPAHNMLIVADAHLEKGSWFARFGFHLPPYDSHQTLTQLLNVAIELKAEKILILGDFFHDNLAYQRLSAQDINLFERLQEFFLLWIKGNHDAAYIPEGVEVHDEIQLGNIVFRHETIANAENEISGHFHPKSEFVYKGKKLAGRCFVEDGKKLILPAFGAYTGGLSINDKIFKKIFLENPKRHIIINERIISI